MTIFCHVNQISLHGISSIFNCGNSSRYGSVCLSVFLVDWLVGWLASCLAVWLCHCFTTMFLSFDLHEASSRYSYHEMLAARMLIDQKVTVVVSIYLSIYLSKGL